MWSDETFVDDWVKKEFEKLGLKKGSKGRGDYAEKGGYSDFLGKALEGASKTEGKMGKGIPDFTIEKYSIPVLIENKLGKKRLESTNKEGIKLDDKSVGKYALNGALHYAKSIIVNTKDKRNAIKEALAIGIAGDSEENVALKVYFVFGYASHSHKAIEVSNLNFLESKQSFEAFYQKVKLNEEEKHKILIKSKEELREHAKKLNKLMHNHNITAPQRVLYISGMLLAMQSIAEQTGLTPKDLTGNPQTSESRDSNKIMSQIKDFLKTRVKDEVKFHLMLDSFKEISKDRDRDKIQDKNDKIVSKILSKPSSITKQIFAYLYEYIYYEIDNFKGHLDIMGEMYSEFLKYALGDGKELGIVLTPPYVTKMMAQILEIHKDCRVMDLATGSAGFLISSMELMKENANETLGENSTQAKQKIEAIKKNQLLGVELNAEMFALATTNMILRGDGSSKIEKANTFQTPPELYEAFKADRILLNPPFTEKENGMPFIKFGLHHMKKGGLGAIIIQDSAGSGEAIQSNKEILKHHTLKASIKMPKDLFQPMAGVQTSIYIFEAKIPHDYQKLVKFIDFRNDGYKRTSRSLQEIDNPQARYSDIIKIYKAGLKAKVEASWNLAEIYLEDYINDSGVDWNFDQHKVIDTKPTLKDFKKCVGDYLAWEVSNVLKKEQHSGELSSPRLEKLEGDFKQSGGEWREYKLTDLFTYQRGKRLTKNNRIEGNHPLVTAGEKNKGVKEFIGNKNQTLFKNAITIDMFCNSFVHIDEFCCDDNVLVLNAKTNISKEQMLFISTIINKDKEKWGYGKQYRQNSLEKHFISLPTHANGQIAFDFMEKCIRELEVERVEEIEQEKIQELEAYLQVSGLKDYALNDKEKETLDEFKTLKNKDILRGGGGEKFQSRLEWKEYKIGDLFEIKPTKSYKMTNSTLFDTEGDTPVVTNSSLNNGISGYVNLEATEKGRMITYSDTTTSEGIFYQPKDFIGYSHVQGLYPTKYKEMWDKYFLLYVVCAFRKSAFGRFDYGNKFNRNIAKDIKISLPVAPNGQIAFDFMETFIKAIEKESIKDVVLWSEKELKAYKEVVNSV